MNVKVKVNLNLPDFGKMDLSAELLEVANKDIIPDLVTRIEKGVDINDRNYAPLAESTIKRKQKLGHNSKTLIATGKLRSSFEATRVSGKSVMIRPAKMRSDGILNAELGDILQNRGVRTKNGKRFFEFFGISKVAEERAVSRVEMKIRKEL
jgi:hypothetical protein